MDRVEDWRNEIKRILTESASVRPAHGDIEVELVFDDERAHYELVYTGWNGYRRVHGAVIHIDIKGDKVWIQHDGTEESVADQLIAAGIPQDRIVLAFHHPGKRQYTGFAVS
ncbi:MAG TPA: XisI protein [Candidatus Xenobia bacterium]|jgi:hypothetical protein